MTTYVFQPPLLLFWQLIPFFRRTFLYFFIIALHNENVIQLHIVLRAILTVSAITELAFFAGSCQFMQYCSVDKH